jgi:carbamoyltransferase
MTSQPWVLGISCSHNGSACLLHGQEIVAAVQDERLVRVKRKVTRPRFARYGVAYCLEAAGITPAQLDMVVYAPVRGETPATRGDICLNEYLNVAATRVPVVGISHHYGHAVSVFATSGFRDAAVLVIDGSGTLSGRLPLAERAVVLNELADDDREWLSHYDAAGTTLVPIEKQVTRSHPYNADTILQFGSIGDMYAAVGQHLFGSEFEGPGKVMGLAPYGTPSVPLEQWLTIQPNGRIDFHPDGLREAMPRCTWPGDFQACADLAASVQRATEHALLQMVARVRARSGQSRLCYAGGVALNSVANERIVRDGGFDDVFIMPAAEDSGVAIGAAYHGLWLLTHENAYRRLSRDSVGRRYSVEEVADAIASTPAVHVARPPDAREETARLLRDGRIVGWFDGGSELGPRALGQRSILCDPRRADGKEVLNQRVKHREGFRPFAPVVLREQVEEWFEVPPALAESPFMLRVWPFRAGRAAQVPAVAHVDGSARVQTVTAASHPALYSVIRAFAALTGVPMLLNTSFNVAGEPIVETPEDALACLLQTGIDCCVFGDQIVYKDAFASILDLPLHLVARSIAVEMPVVEGRIPNWHVGTRLFEVTDHQDAVQWPLDAERLRRLRAQMQRHVITTPVAYSTGHTRWGEMTVRLSGACVALLAHLDGVTTGRQLLAACPDWDERTLVTTLSRLCRASLIRFGHPVAGPARRDRPIAAPAAAHAS